MKDLNITEKKEIVTTGKKVIELTNEEIKEALKLKLKQKNVKDLEKSKKEKINNDAKNSKKELSNKWLLDTKGVNAIITYLSDAKNSKLVDKHLKNFNVKNGVNFETKHLNKLLLNFAYLHEVNDLDLDGKILNRKNLFNIDFFTYSLLTRKAKYTNCKNANFVKISEKSTLNHLLTRYENKVNSFKFIIDKDKNEVNRSNEVNLFIDSLIFNDANITKQKIVNALIENFTE